MTKVALSMSVLSVCLETEDSVSLTVMEDRALNLLKKLIEIDNER
jgi:hypothetical protein